MPCNSSYLEPNAREKDSQEAASFLVYLARKGVGKVGPAIKETADEFYGNPKMLNSLVVKLCKLLKSMKKPQLDKLVYDGRNSQARALADWWEKHQEADKKRAKKPDPLEAKERREYKRLKLKFEGRK